MVLSDCSTTGIIEFRTRYPTTDDRVGEVDKDNVSKNQGSLPRVKKMNI